jgi:hypothetical protein
MRRLHVSLTELRCSWTVRCRPVQRGGPRTSVTWGTSARTWRVASGCCGACGRSRRTSVAVDTSSIAAECLCCGDCVTPTTVAAMRRDDTSTGLYTNVVATLSANRNVQTRKIMQIHRHHSRLYAKCWRLSGSDGCARNDRTLRTNAVTIGSSDCRTSDGYAARNAAVASFRW